MVLSLIGPLDNHRVHRVLLVAAYAGTKLKVVPLTLGRENETESYRRNCHPLGRVPALKSDEGYLFETNAIIRHLARTERPYGADGGERHPSPHHKVPYVLYGGTLQEAAEVDAWLDYVLAELDPHLFPLLAADRGAAAGGGHERALKEGLGGLELRVALKKQQLWSLARASGGRNSAAAATALAGVNAEAETEDLSDEDYLVDMTPRETTVLRGYHTYNIKTCMDVTLDPSTIRNSTTTLAGADAHITLSSTPRVTELSPRPRIHTQHSHIPTPRKNGEMGSSDMIFLVGNSLTAADLVVALAVNQALLLKNMNAELRQLFPQLLRFRSNILRLPLAVEVRKSLGINII